MKYIFCAGAPGSKWSSVVKNIYYSPDIDRTDYSEARTYWHDAPGQLTLMHTGAYFDPGMEFDLPEDITTLSQAELEQIFDSPFSGSGTRIIKSHIFCHHIDFLRKTWPDCPVVTVYRPSDACLGWWIRCGHFDITYPDYSDYYVDLRTMSKRIDKQTHDLVKMLNTVPATTVWNNQHLCESLGLQLPPDEYYQSYPDDDVDVKIYKGK